MAKKIQVDIDYLKSIGLSHNQISNIIKQSEHDHWTNSLPQGNDCYELLPFMITPESRVKKCVNIACENQHDPILSFFTEKDAEFIQNKCRLLIEMSNFSFSVNGNWIPDWNDKYEKKFGIILQNGQAIVKENEFFNTYVFGIVVRNKITALEMLEEFKDRVEIYFNSCFNSSDTKAIFSDSDSTLETINSVAESIVISDKPATLKQTAVSTQVGKLGNLFDTNGTSNDVYERPDSAQTFNFSNAPTSSKRQLVKKSKVVFKNSDIIKIQDLILKNVSQKEIAEQFGCSQSAVSKLKESLGFKMNKSFQPNEEEIAIIKDLLLQNIPQKNIAKQLNCKRHEILKIKKELGFKMQSRIVFNEEQLAKIKGLIVNNVAKKDIAIIFNCSQGSISRLKRSMNL